MQGGTELWDIAEAFRIWVTGILQDVDPGRRHGLRGDYLFVINEQPKFVLAVDRACADSWEMSCIDNSGTGSARVTIETDSRTLGRLLDGTLRARVAYLTGRVRISGDLPAFLQLVSLLRARGVRPPGSTFSAPNAPAPQP